MPEQTSKSSRTRRTSPWSRRWWWWWTVQRLSPKSTLRISLIDRPIDTLINPQPICCTFVTFFFPSSFFCFICFLFCLFVFFFFFRDIEKVFEEMSKGRKDSHIAPQHVARHRSLFDLCCCKKNLETRKKENNRKKEFFSLFSVYFQFIFSLFSVLVKRK